MTNVIIKQLLKTIIGKFTFHVDREKRLVTITTRAGTKQLTYDQVIDIAEELLKDE